MNIWKGLFQNVFPGQVEVAVRVNKIAHTDRTQGGTG